MRRVSECVLRKRTREAKVVEISCRVRSLVVIFLSVLHTHLVLGACEFVYVHTRMYMNKTNEYDSLFNIARSVEQEHVYDTEIVA